MLLCKPPARQLRPPYLDLLTAQGWLRSPASPCLQHRRLAQPLPPIAARVARATSTGWDEPDTGRPNPRPVSE